ncbi:MAG: WG repeat-containing protein, partial [Ruminococcus sp.]|nr:WG repeat-containing protein [Ruminococcus sp.]
KKYNMNIKSKKILAQILSVAVAGSNFVVPVVCTGNGVIKVNAEESEQDIYEENDEAVTDEDNTEEDNSEENYYDEDSSDEDYSEDDYSEDDDYQEESDSESDDIDYYDDTYETDELDIEETTPQESEQKVNNIEFKKGYNENQHTEYAVITAYSESGDTVWTYNTGEYDSGQFAVVEELGEHNNVYYLTEGGTIKALDFETGEVLWKNSDFEGASIKYAFGENSIYISGYVYPDFYEVSYEGETLKRMSHLKEDYATSGHYWVDNLEIIDNKYLAVYFSNNDSTLYVDLQTYEVLENLEISTTTSTVTATTTSTETTTGTTVTTTTTTKESAITYKWYVEPSVEADDINSVGAYMEAIPSYDSENSDSVDAYNDYIYRYGQFVDTGYAVIKEGDFYGVIDMDGNVVIEPDYIRIRGAINDHFILYDEEDNISYFCCETGEFLEPKEPYCAWCENNLLSDVSTSYYCYDPEKDLFAYVGVMPSNDTVEEVSLNSKNSSLTTLDFPEGKTIPVRMVSIDESEDKVILYDSYGIMRDGEIIIDFDYDNALSYKDGITALERDGEWYYFDEEGNQIIENPCEASYLFNVNNNDYTPYLPSEDYIAFNTIWGGGYYATDGEVVIPVGEFAEVRPVCNGLAWVKDHTTGLWGVIELTGERAGTSDDDNNDDSGSDDEDGDNDSDTDNNKSSSGTVTGKASPKTGDNFGNVFALLAVSVGVMFVSGKRKDN